MRVLSPDACGTNRHVNAPRYAQSVIGPECSNYHEGSELCNIASGHPINSAQRVLNNTEVKERNTICRHACFGVYASSVQLCNTSRCVTRWYLSTYECSHQTHVVQPATSTHPDMRRVLWSQSAQTTTREVSFATLLADTQSTLHRECSTTPK